jgi:DNA-binding MarR family transcriptional regulator
MSLCVEFSRPPGGTIAGGGRGMAAQGGRRRHGRRAHVVKMHPLTGLVGYALRRAQGVLFADFNDALAELDLRPVQFSVLALISENPGASQSSVSAALGMQKANLVTTISDLAARGLVVRRRSVADGRTNALELTARGRRVLERAAQLQSAHEARITARLGVRGRERLLELLGKLSELG